MRDPSAQDDIRDTTSYNQMTTVIPKVIYTPHKLQDDIRDTKSYNKMTTVIPKVIYSPHDYKMTTVIPKVITW